MNHILSIIQIVVLLIIVGIINNCSENPTEIIGPPNIDEPSGFRIIDFEPAWSPNGNQIAYVHGDTLTELTGIYLIDINGTNNRLLISEPSASTPAWTPNGNWIVFEMYTQIWKIKASGDSLTQLTTEGRNFFPSVSPDGKWIVFDSNLDSPNGMNFLWKMKIDGTNKTRIAYEPEVGEIRMPYWSINNQIIHIRYSQDYFSTEIFVMDSNGQNNNRITFNETSDSYPRYLLKYNKIAYTSQAEGEYSQIWVVNEDGTNPIQLTRTQGYTCDWSPDGEKIVYTDSRAENGFLWIMNSDGSNPKQLTFNKN